jgi:hypothetical protein
MLTAPAFLAVVVVLCASALAWPAAAAPPPPVDQPPTWQSLTPAQQSALAPLRRDWPTIDSQRKLKWLEVAGRFRAMPEADRERVQARMAEWARMTPSERARARLQFQASRQFSPEDRQALWEAYQALTDDERRALAQRTPQAPRAASAVLPSSVSADSKRNVLPPGRQDAAKPVTPTVVQAQPGVSTTLMSTKPAPPAHQQAGMPKIAASEGFVNPTTLLPMRGPQGAAVSAASASDAASQP